MLLTWTRFEYTNKKNKLFGQVSVQEEFLLNDTKYKLKGFVVHAGVSADYGHYYTVCNV